MVNFQTLFGTLENRLILRKDHLIFQSFLRLKNGFQKLNPKPKFLLLSFLHRVV